MTDNTNPPARPDDNVEEFVKQQPSHANALDTLDQEYKKFKYLESRLVDQKANLTEKVPEIQRTLDIVEHLKKKSESEEEASPITSHFELTNGMWAEGTIKNEPKSVFLWLGVRLPLFDESWTLANVMVEYSYDEAIGVLSKNLESGKSALEKVTGDLEYLKDQITITEVNISRVYNYGVKTRKAE